MLRQRYEHGAKSKELPLSFYPLALAAKKSLLHAKYLPTPGSQFPFSGIWR
jgi:hypothetical protein